MDDLKWKPWPATHVPTSERDHWARRLLGEWLGAKKSGSAPATSYVMSGDTIVIRCMSGEIFDCAIRRRIDGLDHFKDRLR